MSESYCRSCYRPLPVNRSTCVSCAGDRTLLRPISRLPLLAGSVGVPLLIIGILTLNVHACLAGAIISGCAALAYAALALRSD